LKKGIPESIENCLITFKKSWSDIDNLLEINQNWENIVGKDLAKECKPLKIENRILTVVANHPQWRQALIYNKHKLKDSINKFGIKLFNIRVIQNYQSNLLRNKSSRVNEDWDNHPSRIKSQELINCKFCQRPTPKGEIKRWGKCSFCWRVN
tara:strand:+ start:901 stop:1356 length:456 start_codon:yes stop_codon:yes gene_type:complete